MADQYFIQPANATSIDAAARRVDAGRRAASMVSAIKTIIRRSVALASNLFTVLIVLPVLYLVEPLWRFRIGFFHAERLGHLSGDPLLYLVRRNTAGMAPRTTHILFSEAPCNRQLFGMWQRRLPIHYNRTAARLFHYNKNILPKTRFFLETTQTSNDHKWFAGTEPRLTFTEAEHERGRALLMEMGIGPNDWYACVHVRDPAYSQRRLGVEYPGAEADGHRVRNGNILDYLPAVERICGRGGFVLRTGEVVDRQLPNSRHPRIIDYASNFRSDFGDIYLAAHARFYLGGPSGLAQTHMLFRSPVALASMVPLTPHAVGPDSLYIPVLLRDARSGSPRSYREAFELGAFAYKDGEMITDAADFARLGLTVEQSSPDDIVDLCQDMLDQMDGISPTAEAARLQDHYRRAFTNPASSYLHAPSIGPRFALKYSHLIDV